MPAVRRGEATRPRRTIRRARSQGCCSAIAVVRGCWPGRSTASRASRSGLRDPPRPRHLPGRRRPEAPTTTSSRSTPARPAGSCEVLLGAALLYHALNGLRIMHHGLLAAHDRLPQPDVVRATGSSSSVVGLPGAFIILQARSSGCRGGDEMAQRTRDPAAPARRAAASSWPSGTSCGCPGWPCSCWRWPTSASCTSCSTRPGQTRSFIATSAGTASSGAASTGCC